MSHGVKILLVEDDHTLAQMLIEQLRLEHSDWNIKKLSDGREAYQELSASSYDAVISDFDLPAMSGLTLLRAIREAGSDCPFIFLTGYSHQRLVLEALALGAFDFLEKPFNFSRFLPVVQSAVAYSLGLKAMEQEVVNLLSSKGVATKEQTRRLVEARRQLVLLRFSRREGKTA